jgi:cytochrome c-type biogenesis protein CcmE
VIALSVAAALAIFVVYTALAGHTGTVSLMGKVVGRPQPGAAYTKAGMRFRLKDIGRATPARVPVVYHGSVPDQFKSGRDVVIEGTLSNGVFVAKPGSLITKCPSHYAPAKSSNT